MHVGGIWPDAKSVSMGLAQAGVTEHQGCRRTGYEPHRSPTAGTVGKELRMGPTARLQQEEHSDLLLELGLIENVGFLSLSHGDCKV